MDVMAKVAKQTFISALKSAAASSSYVPKSIRGKYEVKSNATVVIKKSQG